MPFPRLVGPTSAPSLGRCKGRSDEALFFFVAKLVGNIRQNLTQNVAVAPRLKPTMRGFIVRIALRQHVPLRPCVENPQDCFEYAPRRNRFASRTTIGNALLREMLQDALPVLVAEPNHPTFKADRVRSIILR